MIYKCIASGGSVQHDDIILIQGEHMANTLEISGLEKFKSGYSVYLDFLLPRRRKVRSEVLSYDGVKKSFVYALPYTITQEAGNVEFEIVIYGADDSIAKMASHSTVIVNKSINAIDSVEEPEISILEEHTRQLSALNKKIEDNIKTVNSAMKQQILAVDNKVEQNVNELKGEITANATNINNKLSEHIAKANSKVVVVYDKNSADAQINWGYKLGICSVTSVKGKDFTPYKAIRITVLFNNMRPTVCEMPLDVAPVDNEYRASASFMLTDIHFLSSFRVLDNKTTFEHTMSGYYSVNESGTLVWSNRSNNGGEYWETYNVVKIEGIKY